MIIKFKQIRENQTIQYNELGYLPRIGECVNLYDECSRIVGVVIKIVHEYIPNSSCITIEVY